MPFELTAVATAFCATKGYALIGGVGQGAFKEAYRVQLPDGSVLALKVYKPGFSAERTTREMEAMLRCSHANIARLASLDTFDFEAATYVVSLEEFLPGGTLTERLVSGGVLTPGEITTLGSTLADAVGHIASLRLVHRDLKPDNIMFRDVGNTPVIVDFGLVRDLARPSLTGTWLMRGPGTPYYAPPEQLRNEKAQIDWRADQFSLGVVLSVAAFGKHPYEEAGDDMVAIIERVAERQGPATQFTSAAQAVGLGALVHMVAGYPVQRFRTPEHLARAWPRGA